jgi:hypothetical protein
METLNRSEALLELKLKERQRFAIADAGLIDRFIWLKPCKVKILMLVDNSISFNHAYFGLSTVLDTLRMNPEWWVNFEVTKAHRQTDISKPPAADPAYALYGPDFENFHFDQAGFDINDYDQVWFFGFNDGNSMVGSPPEALTDDELKILYRWMNEKNGGVFAVGDHYTLGEALCQRIPRVRNMRKWTIADGVPSGSGQNRHDTNVKGRDYLPTGITNEAEIYSFDDESDDIPMKLRLRWYRYHRCSNSASSTVHPIWPYYWRRSPHPVLCGEDGPIDVFPDHPHEGEVVVPSDLNDEPSFSGYKFREYPDYSGSPKSPEIIAWARVQNDHTNMNDVSKGQANGKEFGAVGAYDGHCVNVGRVVVDSTWHHWFDVNLTGRASLSGSADLRKHNGFEDTPSGIATLNRIKNYFRNVAIWLSPEAKLRCMSLRAMWGAIHRFPLTADLNAVMPAWQIGHHAINVLGKYAGQCNVYHWWHHLMPKKFKFEDLMDFKKLKGPNELVNSIDNFAIGGILKAMLLALEERDGNRKIPSDKELLKIAQNGLNIGFKEMQEFINDSQKSAKHISTMLNKVLK